MHPFRHQETDLDGMDSRPLEARSCLVAFRQVILGAVRRRYEAVVLSPRESRPLSLSFVTW